MGNNKDFNIPTWLSESITIIAVISISFLFFYESPFVYPNGDSYIHFAYARNLVEHHELTYNLGIDEGIGSSSFLWVLILAFFSFIGISPIIAARFLGVLLLCGSALLFHRIVSAVLKAFIKQNREHLIAFLTTLIFISGSIMWNALSGMESVLFLFLGLLSIWVYKKNKFWELGLVLGLQVLTRPEGIILAGTIILIDIFSFRRIRKEILSLCASMSFLLLPWFLYLQLREGAISTTSLQGRQIFISETERMVIAEYPWLEWVIRIRPIFYTILWLLYSVAFISGQYSLPGLSVPLKGSIVGWKPEIPIINIIFFLFFFSLMFYSFIKEVIKNKNKISVQDPNSRILVILMSWIFLHNIAYSLFVCSVGAGGRYSIMNHILFWISLFFGAYFQRRKIFRALSLFLSMLSVILSVIYWKDVYTLNVNAMINMRIPTIEFINNTIPKEEKVGTTDLGPIGYFSNSSVVDLGGHINKDICFHLENGGSYSDYIDKEKLCYIMFPGPFDGVGANYLVEMGLSNDHRFRLTEIALFSIPLNEWQRGSEPLGNYLPSMYVYMVDWNDKNRICQ